MSLLSNIFQNKSTTAIDRVIKEIRSNPVGGVLFLDGQVASKSVDLRAYLKEGYKQNVIAYRCMNEIATCLAGIELELWKQEKTSETLITDRTHPLVQLINRPNPIQGRKKFFRALAINYLFAGNSFTIKQYGVQNRKVPKELWHIPPVNVQVMAGKSGLPLKYKINGNETVEIPVDQVSGESPIIHISDVNPESNMNGISIFESSALSVDLHNSGLKWNYSLLENGGKPSMIIKSKEGGKFTEEQKAQITEWLRKKNQGSENAGAPLMLSGMEIEQWGFSPLDMDYKEIIRESANNICIGFGVPAVLITGEGNTFNNMKEARESFYENRVLPLLDEILDELNRSLCPAFGEGLVLKYNPDSISALEGKRARKYERVEAVKTAGIITANEARIELGFKKLSSPLADTLLVPASNIPIDEVGLDIQPSDTLPPTQEELAAQKEEQKRDDKNFKEFKPKKNKK